MSEQKTKTNEIKNVAEALELIPKDWGDAELCIGSKDGRITKVRRIALQQNDQGRRVVVIYACNFQAIPDIVIP